MLLHLRAYIMLTSCILSHSEQKSGAAMLEDQTQRWLAQAIKEGKIKPVSE